MAVLSVSKALLYTEQMRLVHFCVSQWSVFPFFLSGVSQFNHFKTTYVEFIFTN